MSKNPPWTDAENDLIVADYFVMLAEDLAGRNYNKAEHRRMLMSCLQNRSEPSIEFKHRNISAVLKGLGESWIHGYRPAFNFQLSLVEAVVRWLGRNPTWLERIPGSQSDIGVREPGQLKIVASPRTGKPTPELEEELPKLLEIADRFDVAGRDARNRVLGRAGEECVLAHERAVLTNAGRTDLARRVRWVSEEDGDGAGYDIESYAEDGRPRLIEVKTTNGWERSPFYISRNELTVADKRRTEWRLIRLWDFTRSPKAFELCPPLEHHVSLTPMNFRASLR